MRLAALVLAASASAAAPIDVRSPSGDVRIALSFSEEDGAPRYRVSYRGRAILGTSRLGAEFAGGHVVGGRSIVERVSVRAHAGEIEISPGKRRRVPERYAEAVVTLREDEAPHWRWELWLRAYDDGAALRYRFLGTPGVEGDAKFALVRERTSFDLSAAGRVWELPLRGYTTSYERFYLVRPVAELEPDAIVGLPLLAEIPGTGWAALTEADLVDYAGLYVARAGDGAATLEARLSPLPGPHEDGRRPVAVRGTFPHASPWRVVLVGETPGDLVESDLVLLLARPTALADTSWIATGKTTFPWWNGFHVEDVPFDGDLNTATALHYIDFCAEAGIPYHSLDGVGDRAWYGGPIVPYEGADITTAVPEIDLPTVLAHARERGVRLRFWMHWEAARAHMDRAFPIYREWGIEGVMIDFMDRDDQEMVAFLRRLLDVAAANHLTVTFHGVCKPTGWERTYPHLLSSEGVLNLEYTKWDPIGCPPEHEVTVPFTRMLAGPLDFHQGSLRGVKVEEFAPRSVAPRIVGTPARTIASYVVYQNHLSMVADYPAAYRGHPALALLAEIPTTWDDTHVLDGVVGESIVIARRSGEEWYVGAMNDRHGRELGATLDFLGEGAYRATVAFDDPASEAAGRGIVIREIDVSRGDRIPLRLRGAGGAFVRIRPSAESR